MLYKFKSYKKINQNQKNKTKQFKYTTQNIDENCLRLFVALKFSRDVFQSEND